MGYIRVSGTGVEKKDFGLSAAPENAKAHVTYIFYTNVSRQYFYHI
jgi:hypothetical protein